ncbi:MAG: PD-(D/E)XK nuclease family protein [bacterium]|nr:MAG: PD-(D/E)XK nuclease family protein [bacterium]
MGGSGPRPGCLHASRLSGGGHTGRPYTFIIGMDDSRHPGAGLQDPVLLDRERAGISDDLPTAAGTQVRRAEELRGMIARLRGEVVMSWSSLDLADDRELFPAAICQELLRYVTGELDAQAGRLMELAGPAAAFTPGEGEACADETEWWLRALLKGDRPANARETIHQAFPRLAAGRAALAGRLSDTLTPWDGLVDLHRRHDPLTDGPAMSATRLETIGRCPLAYFFSDLLGVKPPEDPGAEREVWLEPLHFGSLLHDVLHRFMSHVMERGESPSLTTHMEEMETIVADEARRYREKYPPPDDTLYREQVNRLTEAARVFLQDEEEAAGEAEPFLLEQRVGLDRDGQPMALVLPGGVTIRSSGRIDRIDRLAGRGHRYRITDYKSGSAYRYDVADAFRQGRTVQQALYIRLAERLLKDTVDPGAVVEEFRYAFPASRTVDEAVFWHSSDLAGGDAILALLVRAASGGAFCSTDTDKDCRYCDYRDVCGDLETLAKAAGAKLSSDADNRLDCFRELRGRELRDKRTAGDP